MPPLVVTPVVARDPRVAALVDELTAELARAGYTPEETFGYSLAQLEAAGVHLVGAWRDDTLVGIGGLEAQPDRHGELKRFYVSPDHRGTGAADAVLRDLLDHARARGLVRVRLETGVHQHAAIAFYARHGFTAVERFGPYVDSATSWCLALDLTRR